jgi:hypothetical protein
MLPAELGGVFCEELVCAQRLPISQASKNFLRLDREGRFVPNWLAGRRDGELWKTLNIRLCILSWVSLALRYTEELCYSHLREVDGANHGAVAEVNDKYRSCPIDSTGSAPRKVA